MNVQKYGGRGRGVKYESGEPGDETIRGVGERLSVQLELRPRSRIPLPKPEKE